MCVVSDKNESIIKGVSIVYANVPHLASIWRLWKNVKPAGSYLYCVYDSGRMYIVDIERGTCNCGWYQIDEIPCPHGIVVLKSKNVDVKEYGRYCSEFYRSNTIVKTYELPIVSMPDKKDWNVPFFVDDEEVLSPKYRRPPGRPKKGRHLKSSESLSSSSNR
ncbi:uncharacterized protein LOC107879436 [Capsicum annuum]|uniref:uncharacterized protein LOC107879436 n=1 Tax=Capsicum annuum TaxID=4072 RepID=UPI001FB05304|nr:uncharacterized protein LOC107879436 [Capsicum annuum]